MTAFSDRLTLKTYTETSTGFKWVDGIKIWANVGASQKRSTLSSHGFAFNTGLSVKTTTKVSDFSCFSYNGKTAFVTSAEKQGVTKYSSTAVEIEPVSCRFYGDDGDIYFQGIVTEMWLAHSQGEPMQLNTTRYLLIVPKGFFTLLPGRIVKAGGVDYEIVVAHELDPARLEYEIERRYDL